MKKLVSFLIGIMVMISIAVSAQINIKNASGLKIKILSTDGLNSLVINPGQTASATFLKESGGVTTAKVQHWTYADSKFSLVDDGSITFKVTNGKAVFTGPGQEQAQAKESKVPVTTEKTDKSLVTPQSSGAWFSHATVLVQNKCTKTITGYSDPFLGLCLESKQTTQKAITLPTGNIQAAFCYDEDVDSIATGKNRKWAVLDKAIPEGLDTLKIYNSNLTNANTGTKITKLFRNATNIGYMIINDDFTFGKKSIKTISPNSSQKIEFFPGWNVMVLQYKDQNGYPRQAVLLFMVTEKGWVINLTKKFGKENTISEKDLQIE